MLIRAISGKNMKPYKHAIWALALLAACGGNPFLVPTDPVDPDPDSGTPIGGVAGRPVGTASPSRDRSIFRREARDTDGGGYVTGVTYNNANN